MIDIDRQIYTELIETYYVGMKRLLCLCSADETYSDPEIRSVANAILEWKERRK